ncbi:CBASS cGAMP-activated phospholipase [Kordiimonas sp.]|uniref:CBASS cGAMP-activated phospholipase n=1 Tax=Kordiimonas sp. TaxID=1970157 RepID=UPI003A919471
MRRRVLSIQGGGVNGIFAAGILARVEDRLAQEGKPCRVGRYFDLVTGTSTGGLIALGVALEIPAANIFELYGAKSAIIFPKGGRNFASKLVNKVRNRPFYNPRPLIDELQSIFGEKRLGDSITRVVIPAYDLSLDRVCLFKTAHHSLFKSDYRLKAWEVAAATTAAPFFFPPYDMHPEAKSATFLDGGVWANNPVLVAAAECIHYCGWPRDELDILTISGVRETVEETKWRKLRGLPSMLINSQVKGSIATAKTLLGDVNGASPPHGKVFDYASDVPSGSFQMDDARSIDSLLRKANMYFRNNDQELFEIFFSKVSEGFQSEYSL